MAGLCAPLSTLRQYPHGYLRMTRGRCGSLLLHRDGLAPSTPCRSPGALRSSPGNGHRSMRSARLKGANRRHRQVGQPVKTRLDCRLIHRTVSYGLDLPAMPQEPPSRIERRLSAILAADVAGYSRLMHHDEEATHLKLTALLADAVEPAISEHGG